MNKLTRDDIVMLLKIAVFVALLVVAIKFFINLLPLIIVLLVILLFADSFIKKNKSSDVQKTKKNKIQDAEIIEEKKNK